MAWSGFDREAVIAANEAAGVEMFIMPPEPDLAPGLAIIWRAWHRLTHSRHWISSGMGAPIPLNIPWEIVRAWCDANGVRGEWAEFFDECFMAMDGVFTSHYNAKMRTPGEL